jgi:hypothetical protein
MSSRKSGKRTIKTASIGTKVPLVVKDALDFMSHKDGMSRASFIEHLIRREAARRKIKIEVKEDDEEADLAA